MGRNVEQVNFVHHQESTSTGTGNELSVPAYYLTSNVEISGTAEIFKLVFEGKVIDNGGWYPVQAINLSTLAINSETTVDGIYQIDLNGLIMFRVNLTEISSGNIQVTGRVVD